MFIGCNLTKTQKYSHSLETSKNVQPGTSLLDSIFGASEPHCRTFCNLDVEKAPRQHRPTVPNPSKHTNRTIRNISGCGDHAPKASSESSMRDYLSPGAGRLVVLLGAFRASPRLSARLSSNRVAETGGGLGRDAGGRISAAPADLAGRDWCA